MKSLKLQHVFSWLLYLAVFGAGSNVAAARLPVRIYTSADGLGSGFVDYVMRDSRGFIWACTRDGLSRFDGSRFINYQVGERNAPPGIENIFETRRGTYFITTTGGTYRFDPTAVSLDGSEVPKLNAEKVFDSRGQFIEDGAGNLWLISTDFYRVIEENGKVEFRKVDWGIPKQESTFIVFEVENGPDGSIWLYTSWGVIRRAVDGRLAVYTVDRSEYGGGGTSTFLIDRNGLAWITFHDQFFVIKPESIEAIPGNERVIVRSITADTVLRIQPEEVMPMPQKPGEIYQFVNAELISGFTSRRFFQTADGDVWISSSNYLLQIEDGYLRVHSSDEGLPNVMGRMADDVAGNLWIGGYNGLARLDRNGLITFGKDDGSFSSQFFGITEGPDGAISLATASTNVTGFDGSRLISVRPSIPVNATQTWTSRFVFRDSRGDFWVLTTGNLYRFSGVGKLKDLDGKLPSKVYNVKDGLKSDIMFQIFEDSKGDIWVSTRGGSSGLHGLARLKKGEEKFRAFSESEGFPPGTSPSSFVEDRDGNIWIGFYEGGFARFDGERFDVLSGYEGFPAKGVISDLLLDSKGRLWLSSTSAGIFRIDDISAKQPGYVSISTESGLSSNNVRTLTEDVFGRIYAGTVSGVDRISPDTGSIKHYSVNDGLAADFVMDSHRDRNGNIWFVTANGASRLRPLPDETVPAPKTFIGGLRVAGTKRTVSELGNSEITLNDLPHTQNNLEIEFFALDFRAGEVLRYQYKLEGADNDWSPPSEQRIRTFANLSPGSYRFLVRAVNSDGAESENPAVISFRILSPIWARWWFVAVAALVIGSVAFAFFRYRIARLREVNVALEEARLAEEKLRRANEDRLAELEKVRNRIATDLHDDIGASLTQITILSEVAQAQSSGGDAHESLSKISDVSNELVGTMSDIVWSINPSKDHLSDLTQRMRRFASDSLSAKGILFQFSADEQNQETIVRSNLRREVFLIFKESVNNIIRHSNAKKVEIKLDISDEMLNLKIADDGIGFESEVVFQNSFSSISMGKNGILSMQKRAEQMHGELEISSQVGQGTKVLLKLPLDERNNLHATQAGGDFPAEKA